VPLTLPIADGGAANITNRSADQAGTDHLTEAAARHHADAGTERAAPATAPFWPDDIFSHPPSKTAAAISAIFQLIMVLP
jgi:hypothetical protein